MYRFILIICLLMGSSSVLAFQLRIEVKIDSTSLKSLVNYFENNSVFNTDTTETLRIFDYNVAVQGDVFFHAIYPPKEVEISDNYFFELINKSGDQLVHGIIMAGHIFLNTEQYTKYRFPDFFKLTTAEHFDIIKAKYKEFRNLSIDTTNYFEILGRGKNPVGECRVRPTSPYVTVNYLANEPVNKHHYTELSITEDFNYTPVIIVYLPASKKYQKEMVFGSSEYYMFTQSHNMIQHGISSIQILEESGM